MNSELKRDVHLVNELQVAASEWAACHGLVMYSKQTSQLTAAPFTLFPTQIPKALFQYAQEIATAFNTLIFNVSRDISFLQKTLASASSDEFTKNLLDIMETVQREGLEDKHFLGIYRSDYLMHSLDTEPISLKQVEVNTIAASFSNLSAIMTKLHRFLLERYDVPGYEANALPQNPSLTEIPAALAEAQKLFGNAKAVVLMIVHAGETNAFDQRWLEYTLWEQ